MLPFFWPSVSLLVHCIHPPYLFPCLFPPSLKSPWSFFKFTPHEPRHGLLMLYPLLPPVQRLASLLTLFSDFLTIWSRFCLAVPLFHFSLTILRRWSKLTFPSFLFFWPLLLLASTLNSLFSSHQTPQLVLPLDFPLRLEHHFLDTTEVRRPVPISSLFRFHDEPSIPAHWLNLPTLSLFFLMANTHPSTPPLFALQKPRKTPFTHFLSLSPPFRPHPPRTPLR